MPVIHNAQLIGRGFVTSGDRLVAESFQQRHARSLGLEHVENGTWRISNRLRMSLHRWQKQHPVSVYERTAILLHDYAIEHFGVWILKILPKLSMAGLLHEDALTVVVPLGLPDKYLNHLTLLGFDPRQILFHDPAGISRFRRLVIPPSPYVFLSPSNRFAFRTDPFGVFVNNQDAWSRFDAIAPHRGRRIFVSRLGNARRKLENEEKIQRLFAEHGFDICRAELADRGGGDDAVQKLPLCCRHVRVGAFQHPAFQASFQGVGPRPPRAEVRGRIPGHGGHLRGSARQHRIHLREKC